MVISMENKSEAIETPGILQLDILLEVSEYENRSGPLGGTFGRYWLLVKFRLAQAGIDKMEELKTQHAGGET